MNFWTFCTGISRFGNFTFQGWIRYLRLKVSGKTVRIAGECSMCGRCCQRISLEANGRWIRKESEFNKVVHRYPEYERFSVVERDRQGFLLFTCSWYLPEGICRDHDNRLPICREFPHPTLYFSCGSVPEGCGYRFKIVTPFSTILQKEIDAGIELTKNTDN